MGRYVLHAIVVVVVVVSVVVVVVSCCLPTRICLLAEMGAAKEAAAPNYFSVELDCDTNGCSFRVEIILGPTRSQQRVIRVISRLANT